jgi:hypothetical protein
MRRSVWLLVAFVALLGMVAPAQAMPALQAGTGIADRITGIQMSVPAWQDDFESLVVPGFWSEEAGDNSERFFDAGAYQIAVYEADTVAWTMAGQLAYEDFLIAVDTTLAAGSTDNEFGIVFRHQDENNFYVYSISSDGYYSLSRLVDGSWETLLRWRRSNAIDTRDEAWNYLELLVENGQLLTTYEDDESYIGGIGLLAGARDDAGVQIAFDDFEVWDLQNLFVLKPGPTITPTRPAPKVTPDPKGPPTLRTDEIRTGRPLRHDDFRSNTAPWREERSEKSAHFVQGGQLHLKVEAPKTTAWVGPQGAESLRDFLLEVEVSHVAGPLDNEMGIVFRRGESGFYYFKISSDGYYALSRFRSGQWEPLIKWTASSAVKTGAQARNLLGVLASGASLTLMVNDVVLATISDSAFTTGAFALAAGTYDKGGVEVAFDDLNIWELGRSQPAPTATSAVRASPSITPTRTPVVQPRLTPTPTVLPRVTVTPTVPARSVTTPTVPIRATSTPITATRAISASVPTPLPGAGKLLGNLRDTPPAFSDEFRRSDSGWSLAATGQVTITHADRRLLFQLDAPNWLAWSTNATVEKLAPVHFLLEVDAQYLKGPTNQGFGLLFAYHDQDNYHRFFTTQNGYFALQRIAKGQSAALIPWTQTPALVTAAQGVNRLGLLVRGEQIVVMANDKVLAQVNDATLTPGRLGMIVSTSDVPGLEVAFDNFDLWQLEDLASQTKTPTPTAKP